MNIVKSFGNLQAESDFIEVSLSKSKGKQIKAYFNSIATGIFYTSGFLYVSDEIKDKTVFISSFNDFLVDKNLKCYTIKNEPLTTRPSLSFCKHTCGEHIEAIEQILFCPKCDKEIKKEDIV